MTEDKKTDIVEGWPQARQFRKSIRIEFSLYVSAVIIVLMLSTGYIIINQYIDTVTHSVSEKLLVQARSYSGPAGKLIISTNGPDALLLNNICKKLAAADPDLYWAGITDNNGIFLAHTDIRQVVSGASLASVLTQKEEHILRDGEAFALNADTILITVPIRENAVTVGQLTAASSDRQIRDARNKSIITVVSITVLMILLGIPATMVVLHRRLRPIAVMTDSLRKIKYDDISLEIPFQSKNEFGYLAETLRVMGRKISSAQKDIIEKERIARELEIAREIQANILPREYPRAPNFEFFGAYRSAREVGGDYYDFIEFDDEHLAFLVADVSGKSLPGMLVMLLTRDIVKRLSRTVRRPSDLLSDVNRELLKNIKKGMFVTMFFGLLNKKTGQFTFASAGHNPLIRINAVDCQTETRKTRGYPLGMVPPEQFDGRIENGHIILRDNDMLVQFTDGINEATNSDKEEYGMERFVFTLESNGHLRPREITGQIMENHKLFVGKAPQIDDITLLVMKWKAETSDKEISNLKHATNVI
ncbi:MAG: PP2C family protein-serine/threonine phosphatase [Candidatus Zixiibacteriota bacterium]|nr:MAG: PP2C family protein-serine/threonine phosphatase [candidate division Zixibacteria bacterium]